MKPLVFCLFLLLFACNLSAQKYFPTLEDNPVWSARFSNRTDIYHFKQDTSPNSPYFLLHDSNLGNRKVYLRVNGKQVWAKYWADNFKKEHLLYDFSKKLNDTFYLGRPYDTYDTVVDFRAVVIDVDSVETEVGYRRRLTILTRICQWRNEDEWVHWIEGIGSDIPYYFNDFLNCSSHNIPPQLLCYKENNTLIYKKFNTNECQWDPSSIHEIKPDKAISIYPNPVLNELNIRLPETFNTAAVDIYTIDGRSVYSDASFKSFEPISIAHLSSGIYIVKIKADGHIYYERVLK